MTDATRRWVCPRCRSNNMMSVGACFRCGQPRSPVAPVPPDRPVLVAPRPATAPLSPPGPVAAHATRRDQRRSRRRLRQFGLVAGGLLLAGFALAAGRRLARTSGLPSSPGASLPGARTAATGTPSIVSAPLATPTGEPSVVNSSGWKETPIREEQPVIRVTNQIAGGAEALLVLTTPSARFELRLVHPYAEIALPPDSYRYVLQGSSYQRTGQPDQFGHLVCRKHRLYSLFLHERPLGERHDEDLGD